MLTIACVPVVLAGTQCPRSLAMTGAGTEKGITALQMDMKITGLAMKTGLAGMISWPRDPDGGIWAATP